MLRFLLTAAVIVTPTIGAHADPSLAAVIDAAREPEDSCGGRGVFDLLVPDGPFLEACRTHDACYRADLLGQNACDTLFLNDMRAACDDRYAPRGATGRLAACNASAYTYYKAVNSKFGSYAYAGGEVVGKLEAPIQRRIAETDGDDELELCVTVTNPGNRLLEYEVTLFDAAGRRVDVEPDLHDEDIHSGAAKTICVDSQNAPRHNWSSVGEVYSVVLRVDDPGAFGPFDDKIEVAALTCTRADGRCDAATPGEAR